jgi:hypothetical protein
MLGSVNTKQGGAGGISWYLLMGAGEVIKDENKFQNLAVYLEEGLA